MVVENTKRLQVFTKQRVITSVVLLALAGAGAYGFLCAGAKEKSHSEVSSQSRRNAQNFTPTPSEWATLTIEPVNAKTFRAEYVTEGKVAVDEDRSTPVFSPYAGRVTKLLAKPGEMREARSTAVHDRGRRHRAGPERFHRGDDRRRTRRSRRSSWPTSSIRRAKDLYEGRAIPLKDYQQAEATQVQAQNDVRSSGTALEAARNKLRILGFTDETIKAFQNKGVINPEITIYAPISGTVVQRKIGPGQYVNSGASDPVFVIGDLSTVWLTAFVRESDAAAVCVGQDISVNVMALPGRPLTAKINYVAAAIDPNTRRLLVRATIDNKDGLLKPEMFANVTIYSAGDRAAPAVPKQALIYEGDQVRIWVAREDKSVELRQIKIGLINGNLVEVTSNLKPGEQVVTKGSLFIDRAASGS